jgi:hypothetical protein
MKLCWLNLDDGLNRQPRLAGRHSLAGHDLLYWGERIRLACSFGRFRRFERDLDDVLGPEEAGPCCTLYGSGDFHHVSLALLRRICRPFNLLVVDNHPDWMRGVPILHCGTWLYHAAHHPAVQRIFHVGGDVDFDNWYRYLAPSRLLRSRKIVVFPALRTYRAGFWRAIPHEPLRPGPATPLNLQRLQALLSEFATDLSRFPLYISLDKDVMQAEDAVVNWDSGHLTLEEVIVLLQGFQRAVHGKLAGVDIVGDWSPVKTQGFLRRFLHWTEHPALDVDAAAAGARNEAVNLALLAAIQE